MSPRPLHELFEADEPVWPVVQSWVRAAKNRVDVLAPDETQRDQLLLETQVSLRSPMGAILYHTGGFFALNGGAFPGPKTEVFYSAPDTLRWEPLTGMGYTEFLCWSFNSDLAKFYESFRWPGWQAEISSLTADEALSIYPPLFTKEGKDIAKCLRRRCPVSEIYDFNVVEFPKELDR
jgi:hypothetical protein